MGKDRNRGDKMKEWIAAIWMGISSLLGIQSGETENPMSKQETPRPAIVEDKSKISAKANSSEVSRVRQVESSSADRLQYESPDEAPWMSPVQGFQSISETAEKGEEGQVTTVWGNGTKGQTERSMDHPRDLAIDSKKNIYFIDGGQTSAKLRVFDGEKNKTVVDLVNNKISRRKGYFLATGLVIIHDYVYISNNEDVYMVKEDRITQYTPKIQAYMKNKGLSDIFRLESYKDYLYIMFMNKSRQFHIARYDTVKGGAIEEIIPTKPMPSPYNFYVHGENEIFISSSIGYVIWEILFPRQTKVAWEFGDPKTIVSDIWIGSNDSLYMMAWENQVKHVLYENPPGIDATALTPVIGSRRGFVDGFEDEVEMDYPTDFIYDGTGFLFADMGNHCIRKLWTNNGPMKK